jgi:hypothetical protein
MWPEFAAPPGPAKPKGQQAEDEYLIPLHASMQGLSMIRLLDEGVVHRNLLTSFWSEINSFSLVA